MTFYDPSGSREGELARIADANQRMIAHVEEETGKPSIHSDTHVENTGRGYCVRCGEKIKGVMALTADLCGLCGDDELNGR